MVSVKRGTIGDHPHRPHTTRTPTVRQRKDPYRQVAAARLLRRVRRRSIVEERSRPSLSTRLRTSGGRVPAAGARLTQRAKHSHRSRATSKDQISPLLSPGKSRWSSTFGRRRLMASVEVRSRQTLTGSRSRDFERMAVPQNRGPVETGSLPRTIAARKDRDAGRSNEEPD